MLNKYADLSALRARVRGGLPWPRASERAAWLGLPHREALMAGAEEALEQAYPQLLASQFMAFAFEGSRQRYEQPYFERRKLLLREALGECAGYEGRYLNQLIDGLWLIAEESSWVISAHNIEPLPGRLSPRQQPLPDKEKPVIDLFSAQTAATLSLCCHLLKEELDGVSPQVVRRIRAEVTERVLKPFMTRDDYWWMGISRQDLNNWTPWILSNVLICLLYWEEDSHRLALGLRRVLQMLQRYIDCLPFDGGMDEGVSYWNVAGASLLDCLELLHLATGGWVDVYDAEKIANIARFPMLSHIAGPWYWNFADCDAQPMLDGERLHRFGQLIHEPGLMRLGLDALRGQPGLWPRDTPQMARLLNRLFMPADAGPPKAAPQRVTLPGLGIWAGRQGRLYAAIKGGHNGESHNHNDLGSFLLYVDGQPAVIDVGNMVYSGKTFSDERYTLWNTRSMNHNVALIGGMEQQPGREYLAECLGLDEDGAEYELRMAYPKELGIRSYRRSAGFKDGAFTLRDDMQLEPPQPVAFIFMLRQQPRLLSPGLIEIGKQLRLRFSPTLTFEAQEIAITDARMARSFPGSIWRMSLSSRAADNHQTDFIWEALSDV